MDSIDRPIPLSKLAYSKIKKSILSGDLKSGEIYSESDLAKQLGVSRTPVREALKELSYHGLINSTPGRGVQINQFNSRDIKEIYELRESLELWIVDKVANNWENFDFKELEKMASEQKKALNDGDYEGFIALDRKWHREICRMAENSKIEEILVETRDIVQIAADQSIVVSGRGDIILEEHNLILEKLKMGDAIGVKNAIKKHLNNSMTEILKLLKAEGSLKEE
jgi:DNA-binding GntR family transcriptional regulator